MTHNDNRAGTQLTDSEPALTGRVIRAVAAAIPSKADEMAGSSSAPSGVSRRRWPARSKSLTPSEASSARIWWLMAPWVTLSSAAALVSEPCRAVASKARSGFSGGSLLTIGQPSYVRKTHSFTFNNINCFFNGGAASIWWFKKIKRPFRGHPRAG